MKNTASVWMVAALFGAASCFAAEEGMPALPESAAEITPISSEKGSGGADLHVSGLYGIGVDFFVISTSGSGNGQFTLATPCVVLGLQGNCLDQKGEGEIRGVYDNSVGVRFGKKSKNTDAFSFEWGGEFYPATLRSNYVTLSGVVLDMFGRAKLNGLGKISGWGIVPYMGVSVGPLIGASVEISYPGMLRPVSGSAKGAMGCVLVGMSKDISDSLALFIEGRSSKFSASYPYTSEQFSVISGDSAHLTIHTRQILFGMTTSF